MRVLTFNVYFDVNENYKFLRYKIEQKFTSITIHLIELLESRQFIKILRILPF
jgi:hypothetical protein